MRSRCQIGFTLRLAVLLLVANGLLWAEAGVLVIHVEDVQRHPISGVQIGVEGDGGSAITGNDGKARIPLAKQTKEKSWISLQILKSPPGKDFVMVSPWDYRAVVPLFENESENFVKVVVVQRGDRTVLEGGSALAALAAQINKANAPKAVDKQALPENPKANLAAVAKQYGLAPDDLDQAIRGWGAKTTDPYEAGLVALYERNYFQASTQLAHSLREREEKLAADQKAVADAAFFLGRSLWEEGEYFGSAREYQRCLQLRPDDSTVLTNLALSLMDDGDYKAAEPLYRHALAIDERALGPEHRDVAIRLNNLAVLLKAKGDYVGAEPLLRRALAIDEKALGPSDPEVAIRLDSLAKLLRAEGDFAGAEPLFQRALTILYQDLGPDDLPDLATSLNYLALSLRAEGNYLRAESLLRRLLADDEKALGPDHPDLARDLNNLAELMRGEGDYSEAEPLYRRALAINEKALGLHHPATEKIRSNLRALIERESAKKTEK